MCLYVFISKSMRGEKIIVDPLPKYYIIFWEMKVILILFDIKCRVPFYLHVFRRNSVSVDNIECSLCV